MAMSDEGQELAYADVLGRIAGLAEELAEWPDPAVAGRVVELLDWIDAFHRDGLGRLAEMIRGWNGEVFLKAVAADGYAGVLLDAYGLGEGARSTTVNDDIEAAMADVRPMIESHGGMIEVDDVTDGVVTVRLSGTCDGCPSSSATLTYGVETALREHWPDFRRLEVVDVETPPDPAKADLTCGLPAPPVASSDAQSVPVQLTRRPAR